MTFSIGGHTVQIHSGLIQRVLPVPQGRHNCVKNSVKPGANIGKLVPLTYIFKENDVVPVRYFCLRKLLIEEWTLLSATSHVE